jgi:hypothetical protein
VVRVVIEGPTGFAPLRDERDRGVFWSEEITSLVRIFITPDTTLELYDHELYVLRTVHHQLHRFHRSSFKS